jgi:FolB domain-containing protein
MNDTIYINDLRLACIIGVREHERTKKQDVIIHIKLTVDLRSAGESDELNDTVSYSDVAKTVTGIVEKSSFFLLEKLAETIAQACLGYKGVKKATVSIEKPNAIPHARSSAIEIIRTNE